MSDHRGAVPAEEPDDDTGATSRPARLHRVPGTFVGTNDAYPSAAEPVSRWARGQALDEVAWRHRFEQVISRSRDAFIEVDGAGIVTEWNRRAEETLGWQRAEVVGRPITDTVLRAEVARAVFTDAATTYAELINRDAVPAGRDGRSERQEVEFVHKDGHSVLAVGTMFATTFGGERRIGGFVHDLSEQRAAEQALVHAYLHDSLTGLPNRALFSYRLAYAVAESQGRAGSVAVVVLDLDRFKSVNDGLGHEAGDDLLVAVSERLRTEGRDAELVARFGADEFLAFFTSRDGDAERLAVRFASGVQAALGEPFVVEDIEVFLGASAGVAVSDGTTEATVLLANAESAMYQAKHRGGSAFETFGESMRIEVVDRMTTEHSLHRALERSELMLHYQPVVDIHDHVPVGVEALVRWQHPEQGLMAPYRFIPVAEESGLIIPIGAWVLEEACHQLRAWQQEGPSTVRGSVEVNLSARQIDHPDIVATVERILATTGLPAASLTLEITESALMRDAAGALDVLRALKEIGVALAIDDFGTGYSSLSYLQRFPLDILKVDKSFVDELGTGNGGGEEIVSAVVTLAHALGLKVVAEGVETEPQLAVLRDLACDYAQGYLFSRPVPASVIAEQLGLTLPV